MAKSFHAGFPVIVSLVAPTSLAVTLAEKADITLVGLPRGTEATVFAHPERLQ